MLIILFFEKYLFFVVASVINMIKTALVHFQFFYFFLMQAFPSFQNADCLNALKSREVNFFEALYTCQTSEVLKTSEVFGNIFSNRQTKKCDVLSKETIRSSIPFT